MFNLEVFGHPASLYKTILYHFLSLELTVSYSLSTRPRQTEISVLFTPKISIPVLCWRIRGTSFQHSGGPSGPTATSPCALYLAHSLEVSEISTRFHVTEILPAITPPLC